MNRRLYSWVVLGTLGLVLAGCQSAEDTWSDIGSPNDVQNRVDESRANRPIPSATEMPPGLGEDLPQPAAPAQPLTKNQ